MLKILSSEYQLYTPQGHFFQGACGKISRMPRYQAKPLVFGLKLSSQKMAENYLYLTQLFVKGAYQR